MEISPSLFDLEESVNVSEERVNEEANRILENYDALVKKSQEESTEAKSGTNEPQQSSPA